MSRKCKDPSKEATKWQGPGNDDYPGIDVYKNRKLKKGTILGNDSNLLIVFYVQIMPDDFVMQLHR
ncbi:hypothetical protein, partial [Enterobacter hormaechei]|uniref:hypothetical protein n=1 Tax=Enterobacter hormaechei TaxID=158836 RepID=UPI001E5B7C44